MPILEPQIDRLNTARKGALKSHIFGAPKVGDRWNAPVLCNMRGREVGDFVVDLRGVEEDDEHAELIDVAPGNNHSARVTGRPHILRYFGCA